jgi:hypothetical protein
MHPEGMTNAMTETVTTTARNERVKGLICIGEMEMTGEGHAQIDAYFAPASRSTPRTGPSGTTRA